MPNTVRMGEQRLPFFLRMSEAIGLDSTSAINFIKIIPGLFALQRMWRTLDVPLGSVAVAA